jgi:hypothetical protein
MNTIARTASEHFWQDRCSLLIATIDEVRYITLSDRYDQDYADLCRLNYWTRGKVIPSDAPRPLTMYFDQRG